MTGSWGLFLLCGLLQGAACNAQANKVRMPKSVTTFSGSCVTVPCSFTVENKFKRSLHAKCQPIWRQEHIDGPRVPDLTEPSAGVMSATFRGNLPAYDCTTTFNNVHYGLYYFRLECSNALLWTFQDTPVTIKGDLTAPRLTPPKEQVVEGTPVELGCSAPSPCNTHPPTVTWTPTLGLSTQLQQDDVITSTLTFNASHRHHGNTVSCTANYFIPSNKTVTSTSDFYQLSILYSPKNTSAFGSPCLPAREGCINLSCTSHANPVVSEYTWYRIHGEHILQIGKGCFLSIKLFNTNNWFFCEVRNDIGTEKSNVYKIDIQKPFSRTHQLPWIAATGVLSVALLFAAVCAVRAWKMADQRRHCKDFTINQTPPCQKDTQVFITSEEDIYANIGVLLNTVGPREEPVGPREEPVPGAGSPASTHHDAACRASE